MHTRTIGENRYLTLPSLRMLCIADVCTHYFFLRPLPLWYAMCKENYKEHLLKSKVCIFKYNVNNVTHGSKFQNL